MAQGYMTMQVQSTTPTRKTSKDIAQKYLDKSKVEIEKRRGEASPSQRFAVQNHFHKPSYSQMEGSQER
jgi:hypothetical protein